MPPTRGKGRGAGGSGSRSQSRRGRSPSRPTPAVTTRSRAAQRELSPSPRLGKRSRVAEKSGDAEGSSSKKPTNTSSQEKASAAASQEDTAAAVSPATASRLVSDRDNAEEAAASSIPAAALQRLANAEEAAASSIPAAASQEDTAAAVAVSPATTSRLVSSIPDGAASDSDQQVSSPLRQPYMVRDPWHQDNFSLYRVENSKYQGKLDRQSKLLSLIEFGPPTCLDDESLLPVRESITQLVFQTAKTVVGLTSYNDGKLLARCSGFFIDWNKDNKRGTILTSADLLCTKRPKVDDWACPREYTHDAEVLIHLLDDTTKKGTLINYHKHYNIAIFEVDVDMSAMLPPVSAELVDYGQEVFLIGRDEDLNLRASHGRVQCVNSGFFKHYHSMRLDCEFTEFGVGGPAIDTMGRIVGMANDALEASFIPQLFTLKCLSMWKDFKCVPRLHLGLKVSSIKLLSSSHREKLSRKLNIEAGIIVIEVSEGSAAEKSGIRNGDIIKSVDGQCIPTVVELEIMLLRKCEDCLAKGGAPGSDVDLMFDLFEIRKEKHCTKMLKLTISDDMEVIAEGTYPVSAEHSCL